MSIHEVLANFKQTILSLVTFSYFISIIQRTKSPLLEVSGLSRDLTILKQTASAVKIGGKTARIRRRYKHQIFKIMVRSPYRNLVCRISSTLLPSPVVNLLGYQVEAAETYHDTAYLSGLRGAASFVVFIQHFALLHHDNMFAEYTTPRFIELPGIRLLYSGHVMVAMFYVISGFALSKRPLELVFEQDWEHFANIIASATFRRGIRIFLPPTFISFFVMIGVRCHLYDKSNIALNNIGQPYPKYMPTMWTQFVDWLEYICGKLIYPWGWGKPVPDVAESAYASSFYTIPREFWASLLLFATLTGLSRTRSAVRIFIVMHLILFAAWCNRVDISCFLAGMIIAELQLHSQQSDLVSVPECQVYQYFFGGAWILMLGLGIWLASIPMSPSAYGSTIYGYRTIGKLYP